MSTVLEVINLETRFETQDGTVYAVNGVSFRLDEGETLGIVGESGCGKSVSMLSILGLIPKPPGKIMAGNALFLGHDLLKLSAEEMRQVRGAQISMIFQDPMTSLNPVLTIGDQIREPLETHLRMTPEESKQRTVELLKMVGISDGEDRLDDYPFQFSGGMRQRVMIAMALTCSPKILIADEPTTALDVTIQAQIIELVKELRKNLGMAIIWITHDLGIIAGLAHRVMVMYAGFIVERAKVDELYEHPMHPYTRGLLGSLPRVDAESVDKELANIVGMPPDLLTKPKGCPFAPRCPYAFQRCQEENPPLDTIQEAHEVACWWNIERNGPRYG
jgi:oligopeptide/dipeptide ABC transporter ATP-binding protein